MSAAHLSDLGEEPDTTTVLAEFREEYNAQQEAIDDLCARLDEARATQNALTTTLAAAGNAAAPYGGDLKIPNLEKYKGDREKLYLFITQLRLKAALYPDHQSQLRYTVSLLEDRALDLVIPHITNDHINLDNLASFIGILETAFGDPDKVTTAERKLQILR